MRFLCFLFLALFTAAVAAFAYFNRDVVTVRFSEYSVTTSLAAVVGVAYLLGMVSGWTLVRMLRRSAVAVAESVERRFADQRA